MTEPAMRAAVQRQTIPAATAARSQPGAAPEPSFLLSVATLWLREVRGFYRQRARVISGIVTPLAFWFVLGSGFGSSLRADPSGNGYLEFFFPGTVMLIVLFASIFANISVIEDRREGFLLSVMAAPVSRLGLVLGKVLGATTIGALQGAVFLPLAPLLDISVEPARLPAVVGIVMATAFGITTLGFFFAWWLNSVEGFHSVMNTVLMPMWLLSGALFPMDGASPWMAWLMRLNPLTYGVTGLRRLLFAGEAVSGPSLTTCWAVTIGFGVVALAAAVYMASRPSADSLG